MPGSHKAYISEKAITGNPLFPAVIRTLLYYDIFNYPLKETEIIRFLGVRAGENGDLHNTLEAMLKEKFIFRKQNFYSVRDSEALMLRRVRGNAMAAELLLTAERQGRLIGNFPFVRSVMASGSLSKGYMDEDSDLDFFIITAPGRLWIARMLLVIYKRIFLFNSKKHFCVNYFITTDHLQIEEKNLFTATELATVVPLCGKAYYQALMNENKWLLEYFPNYERRAVPVGEKEGKGFFKGLVETMLDKTVATLLDRWFMHLTQRRWNKLYRSSYTGSDFQVAFKSTPDASKNHPRNFQRKVIALLEEKWKSFQETHQIGPL